MSTTSRSSGLASTGNRALDDASDVVTFLAGQHERIKALFDAALEARGPLRAHFFHGLRRLLAVHEAAEAQIVHPAVRRCLADGDRIAQARLREERQARAILRQLEQLDLDSREFEDVFSGLRAMVLEHAVAEENEELGHLALALDPQRLARMRKAVRFAEAIAPTRPHRAVESVAASIMFGPLLAVIDRVRDALADKR
jgi:hypothetical protein